MTASRWRRAVVALAVTATLSAVPGCSWRGLNSLPLPGTQGRGPNAFTVEVQMPDVNNIQPNSRVRVGDVTVGTVSKVERQGWHALVTLSLNADVDLPANSVAVLGQTSLLGSLHIELASPTDAPPQGKLHDGSLIPLSSGGAYPSTEQTLAATSMLLNGGGLARAQDITRTLATAYGGREDQVRLLLSQLDGFTARVNDQTQDIISAADSLNRLVDQFAAQKPVLDDALETIPDALAVLNENRDNLIEAADQLGRFSALAADSTNKTREALTSELKSLAAVLRSLGDAGRGVTRSLGLFTTFPFAKDTVQNWFRGDYGNATVIVDLTLSRLDSSLFTGTRFEGNLTELEMQWGRTVGVLPSPYTAGNPLLAPYRTNQGP